MQNVRKGKLDRYCWRIGRWVFSCFKLFLGFFVHAFGFLFAAVYTADDAGSFKTIIQFDCRGIEPTAFDPREGFVVKAIDNGNSFDEVEIDESGDWADFDEKNNNSVAISEFKSQFVIIKGK